MLLSVMSTKLLISNDSSGWSFKSYFYFYAPPCISRFGHDSKCPYGLTATGAMKHGSTRGSRQMSALNICKISGLPLIHNGRSHTLLNDLICLWILFAIILCLWAYISYFYLMHPCYDSQSRPGTQYKSQSYHNNHIAHNVESNNCSFTKCQHTTSMMRHQY